MTLSDHARWKRLAAVLGACVLVAAAVALAGCGSSSDTSDTGDEGGEIVIGVDASMTGPLAGFGAYEKWAIEAAVADHNAKGGVTVDGKQMKVKIVLLRRQERRQRRGRPTSTRSSPRTGAVAIIGPIVPTVGNPAALAAERRGIPYLESGNPLEPFLGVKATAAAGSTRSTSSSPAPISARAPSSGSPTTASTKRPT